MGDFARAYLKAHLSKAYRFRIEVGTEERPERVSICPMDKRTYWRVVRKDNGDWLCELEGER